MPACSPCSLRHFLDDHLLNLLCSLVLVEPNAGTFIEGSLEVKLPTVWTDEKQSRAEAERRGRLEERRSEEKESGRKKMQMREKVGKSRNTVFFQ